MSQGPSKTIGIIGWGDFAQFLGAELSNHYHSISVWAPELTQDSVLPVGLRSVSVQTALTQDVLFLCIPAQAYPAFLKMHHQHIRHDALIVDIASVKVKPLEYLRHHVAESVQIIATHPMFGPSSAQKGLKGLRIMMHPTRTNETTYRSIVAFAEKLGLRVFEVTPEQHDQMMAYVQGLSHYIGRVLQLMRIPETDLMTRAYADLLDMKQVQGGDSWELFKSIMLENPYALAVHDEFEQACKALDQQLDLPGSSVIIE